MRDTDKDEAEFILIVGKFETHYGDHGEAGPWDPGGYRMSGVRATLL